ncbi:MAG TPA: TlpA disulfide reductase family protein [Thermomicrobiales bacterium]|nr:TlpA disulfide reductase family protein [Thermomicrobiales bacterium]
MPGWQRWYDADRPDELELVSVAVDLGGEAAVRPWVERAGARFPTVLDADNRLGALLGYRAIPNGVLLDPRGVIRYAKFGGFDIHRPADLRAVRAALRKHDGGEGVEPGRRGALGAADQERVVALLREGAAKLRAGERAAGLAAWRAALRLDPENLVIRKQLWRADHPERFGEAIDVAWQRDQLAAERARDAGGRGG